jgi:hypothetical protein
VTNRKDETRFGKDVPKQGNAHRVQRQFVHHPDAVRQVYVTRCLVPVGAAQSGNFFAVQPGETFRSATREIEKCLLQCRCGGLFFHRAQRWVTVQNLLQ